MTAPESQPDGFAMAVLVEGGIAIVAVLLAWLFDVPIQDQVPRSFQSLGFAIGTGIVATIPMLVMFWWLLRSQLPALKQLRDTVTPLIQSMFPSATVPQLALIATLAGAGEEFLFRGVIQTVLGWWTTPIVGLLATSLLFGLMHAISRVYFVLATIIGLAFGWMTWYFNDLVGPIVAHSLYDFIALLVLCRFKVNSN